MKFSKFLIICLFILPLNLLAQRGKDGNKIVSTANAIVNEYTSLTLDAAIGNTSITVSNSGLNSNARFSANLSQGDLIMIIQAQGATISGTFWVDGGGISYGQPTDSSWGGIVDYANAGNHELLEVLNVPNSTTIELNCPLSQNYTSAGKVQIVRMPRYITLMVNATASITCDSWNGILGGILAIETDGISTINGSLNVSGKGFRGGLIDNQSTFGVGDVASSGPALGAEKGESIAGYQNDYNIVGGRYCKGAAANGGGGGDAHNAGGGGGGNGGNPNLWKAVGNPSLSSANWANAWNLEWAGLSAITSTGGGKGGYSASNNNQNALTVGPNVAAWGGDNRNKQGGYGGRPLDYSQNKIFFGGGGGAGDGDDGDAGAGGNAGGIIYMLSYGDITGTGTFFANGNVGLNATGTPAFTGISGNDGAGGGGAGGTIILKTTATVSGINCSADGGAGGNQNLQRGPLGPTIVEAEGPGGGGGGGFINSSVALTTTVLGGINGTTNSPSLSEYTPNGATSGGAGESNSTLLVFDIDTSSTTICAGSTANLNATIIGNIPVGTVINWYDAPFAGNVINTGMSFNTPALNTTTSYYIGTCPGTFRKQVTVTVASQITTANAGTNQQVCANTATLAANTATSGTGLWTVVSGSGTFIDDTSPNTIVNALGAGNNVFQWTISQPGCSSSQSTVTINFNNVSEIAVAGSDISSCVSNTTLNATPALIGNGIWSLISGNAIITNAADPTTTITSVGNGLNIFVWSITVPGCNTSTDTITVNISNALSIAQAGSDQQLCSITTSLAAITPANGIGTWALIAGSGTISNNNDENTQITNLGIGLNTFEWTVSGSGCPSNSDQVTIDVAPPISSALAGADMQVCGNITNLNATAPTTGVGAWTVLSGAALLVNSANANSSITNLSTGINSFIWSVTASGCPPNRDTIIVESFDVLSNINAGSDQTICNTNIQLNANILTNGVGLWSVLSGTALFTDSNINNTNVTGLSVGNNILQWNVSNGPCPTMVDSVTITVIAEPSTAIAGSDNTICANQFNLVANTPIIGTGLWSVISGNASFTDATQANTLATNLSLGNTVLQWSITNGTCPPSTDLVTLTFVQPPVANAGQDQVSCLNTFTLSGNVPTAGSGTWSLVSGDAIINSTQITNPTISILSGNSATFQWVINATGCPASNDQVTLNLVSNADSAVAGADQNITLGESVQLNGSLGNTMSWLPTDGLSCSLCTSPLASPTQTTLYYYTTTNPQGCVSTDSLLITVDESTGFFIPTAFSPDGNSVNDILYFHGTGVREFLLEIYDRWGEQVFVTNDAKMGWDGNFRNKPAMAGVYVYNLVITYNNLTIESASGNINLIRN